MLGGTFDPPHLGHAIIAAEVRWRLALDAVVLVPAYLPPHKPAGTRGSADQRLTWTRALAAEHSGLVVRSDELQRSGPSYTVDTLTAFAREAPTVQFWFIMGADQLHALPTWYRWREVSRIARIAAVPRGSVSQVQLTALAGRIAPGRVDVIDVPRVDISSTMIRARIAAGIPVRHLLPEGVYAALSRDGLVPSTTVRIEGSNLGNS